MGLTCGSMTEKAGHVIGNGKLVSMNPDRVVLTGVFSILLLDNSTQKPGSTGKVEGNTSTAGGTMQRRAKDRR